MNCSGDECRELGTAMKHCPNFVYAPTGHEVDSVMVAGQFLMRGRES